MTRTELAKSISFQLDLDFEKVLRGVDAAMDDKFGTEVNEVPA
jgi:hypothetical protein